MSVSVNDVLISGQLLQTHGTTGMELLSGNAHFTAKTEFTAVSETGGGIDINRGAVHTGGENGFCLRASGDNGFGVPVISPVGTIVDHGKEYHYAGFGPTIQKLYNTLTGIQMGTIEAPEGWIKVIQE